MTDFNSSVEPGSSLSQTINNTTQDNMSTLGEVLDGVIKTLKRLEGESRSVRKETDHISVLNNIKNGSYEFKPGAIKPSRKAVDFFEKHILPLIPDDAEVGSYDANVYAEWDELSVEVVSRDNKFWVDVMG